jgi:Mor family transcriptional regulator
MNIERTRARNREIFAVHKNGESIEKLAERYGLRSETIQNIIWVERHRVAVSVDAFYKKMRSQKLRQQA